MMYRMASVLLFAAALAATTSMTSMTYAAIIAGWDQNDNEISPGVFGFLPTDFPQANDHGPASAAYTIADFDATTGGSGEYTTVASFAGTTENDLEGAGSGGSFSFVGDVNNGAKSVFAVPTAGYTDINVSWAQRGTSTGYTSRVFEYSVDGGSNWVDIGAYSGSSGALTSTWGTVSLDFSAIDALEDNADAMFRITYAGASSGSGNNRWDNFYVQGVAVPEPAAVLLLGFAGVALASIARRR